MVITHYHGIRIKEGCTFKYNNDCNLCTGGIPKSSTITTVWRDARGKNTTRGMGTL